MTDYRQEWFEWCNSTDEAITILREQLFKAEARVVALENAIKQYGGYNARLMLREATASETREQFLQKIRAL